MTHSAPSFEPNNISPVESPPALAPAVVVPIQPVVPPPVVPGTNAVQAPVVVAANPAQSHTIELATATDDNSQSRLWLGTLTSTSIHLMILILLALVVSRLEVPAEPIAPALISSIDNDLPDLDAANGAFSPTPGNDRVTERPAIGPELPGFKEVPGSELEFKSEIFQNDPNALSGEIGLPTNKGKENAAAGQGNVPQFSGLNGNGRRSRRADAMSRGASEHSEGAVEKGLAWLVQHQRQDGAWRFDHTDGACPDRYCRNAGNHGATTASTAMALLCFYGAGYTHEDGRYAEVVNKGLYYLGSRMKVSDHGGDFQEGTMYAQGLAAIALSEAAAMTNDRAVRGYAERALKFIMYAQNKNDGGWRYLPQEPGDMTVTGWQLMALKSGQMAEFDIPSSVFMDVMRFLDKMQTDGGAAYGYRTPLRTNSTTAIGLLGRMYLGWKRNNPALIRGINALVVTGPSQTDMYYNYYATQAMLHFGGEPWQKWNPRMRDFLVKTQSNDGHEIGSWYFADPHGDKGGRLYNTCMAIMTLETYYRFQPLYKATVTERGF